jgi:crossover junction endodeoxyribonuclease RusA
MTLIKTMRIAILIDKTDFVTCNESCYQNDKTWIFELPWPSSKLSPNAREHWTTTSKLKKLYRARCKAIGVAAGLGYLQGSENAVRVDLTFFPPDKRARDMDNMLASMKAGLDGLADAMGVDDSKWRIAMEVDEPTKGGVVLVRVTGRV